MSTGVAMREPGDPPADRLEIATPPTDGSKLRRLHRASVALSIAMALPIGIAAAGTRSWTAAVPFGLAVLSPLVALKWGERHRSAHVLGLTWPLLLWPAMYDGAVRIASSYPERYVDEWLAAADQLLFFGHPPDRWALGGPAEELANLCYASYYAMIPACALWVWLRQGDEALARYGLGLVATFSTCAVVWVAAPAGGYHPTGCPPTEAWGPFTAFMRWVYANSPHYAAAFPSSHVSLAVAAAAMVVRFGGPRWLWLWASAIAWSTVQGQYHYGIDTPPAVALGIAGARWAHGTDGIGIDSLPTSFRSILGNRPPVPIGGVE